MNLLIAFAIFFYFGLSDLKVTPGVASVERHSAALGKLRPGDRILAVDGKRRSTVGFARVVSSHHCPGRPRPGCVASTAARLLVDRNGRRVTVAVRPRFDPKFHRTLIGFRFASRTVHKSPLTAAGRSLSFMWLVTHKTVGVLGRIFDAKQRKQLSGLVGTYETTRQAINFDITRAFFLLGVISLSLAVINLFPFLPLDGGHIFWSLVEKLRGRPVPFRVMERAGAMGFVLVILIFFIGLSNDIGRLTGEGFHVR